MSIGKKIAAGLVAILGAVALWFRGSYHKQKAEAESQRADAADSVISHRQELDDSLEQLAEKHSKEVADEQDHLAADQRDHFE